LFDLSIGKFFFRNGDRYEGEFKEGYFNGKGRRFNSKGNLIEEGLFFNGILIEPLRIKNTYFF